MAVKVWDGFDHYGGVGDLSQRSGFLQWAGINFNSFGVGRNGHGKCLNLSTTAFGGGLIRASFGQRVSSAFVGMAVAGLASDYIVFSFQDSVAGVTQCAVAFNPNNFTVEIWGGAAGSGTLLLRTANNVWAAGVWNYVEIWPTVASAGAGGSVQVRINNELVASATGGTQVSANAWWDVLALSTGGGSFVQLDDFYYADTTVGAGTHPCNTPLGDVRVETLFATANSSVAWTPLASTNWQEVAEVAFDGDATYNYSITPGQEDLFTFQPLVGTIATLFGVQVTGAYRKDDASLRQVKNALKSGATEQYGTANSIPDTSYAYFTDQWILDPSTGLNWTSTGVNGLLAGYNLVA